MKSKTMGLAMASAMALWSVCESDAQGFMDLNVEASLVSDAAAVAPGSDFTVALRLVIPENAYVYWRNPGDAGLPVTLNWTLPEGVRAGETEWPAPALFDEPPLRSFGYKEEVVLPVPFHVSDSWNSAEQAEVRLQVRADWLVCREGCVPGAADLDVALPVADRSKPDPDGARLIDRYREKMPVKRDGWKGRFRVGDTISVHIMTPEDESRPNPDTPFFLPYREGLVEPSADQTVRETDRGWFLALARDVTRTDPGVSMPGLLRFRGGDSAPEGFSVEITLVREE